MEEDNNKEIIEVDKVEVNENSKNQEAKSENRKGLCIAAMVLGIISLVFWCIWYISIPCSILAIVFGIIGIKSIGKGMAISGIITGSISLLILIMIFFALFMFGFSRGFYESIRDEINNEDYNYYDYNYYDYY